MSAGRSHRLAPVTGAVGCVAGRCTLMQALRETATIAISSAVVPRFMIVSSPY
jgi:hypothetical protein